MTHPSAYAALSGLAGKTLSGNPPPTGFLITLWALAIFFSAVTIALIVLGIRDLRAARDRQVPEVASRPGVSSRVMDPSGRAGRSGCLFTVAVPCALLAILFVGWLIGIS